MCHRPLALLVILLLNGTAVWAQEKEYKYEIGAGGGVSWGYGDVNPGSMLYSPAPSFDLIWRYNLNLRWALAVDLASDGIKGDMSDMGYQVSPLLSAPGSVLTYDRRCWQLSCRPEVTFWNYGWGSDYREKKRFAPFLTMGLGLALATGEVQSSQSTLVNNDAALCLTLPVGLGLKWKIAPRWNAQLTCLWTKCWGDEIEGLKDLSGIESAGMVKNDWIGSLRLSVTFDFKERCDECHRN